MSTNHGLPKGKVQNGDFLVDGRLGDSPCPLLHEDLVYPEGFVRHVPIWRISSRASFGVQRAMANMCRLLVLHLLWFRYPIHPGEA